MMNVQTVEVIVHTRHEEYDPVEVFSLLYDRVVALRYHDGVTTINLGDSRSYADSNERRLLLSATAGRRLMDAYQAIQSGTPMNCHRFSRQMAGMRLTDQSPLATTHFLSPVETLSTGAIGLISGPAMGVPHSIGYGMGHEGLQVLSSGSELGFVANSALLRYYSLDTELNVALYQMPRWYRVAGHLLGI